MEGEQQGWRLWIKKVHLLLRCMWCEVVWTTDIISSTSRWVGKKESKNQSSTQWQMGHNLLSLSREDCRGLLQQGAAVWWGGGQSTDPRLGRLRFFRPCGSASERQQPSPPNTHQPGLFVAKPEELSSALWSCLQMLCGSGPWSALTLTETPSAAAVAWRRRKRPRCLRGTLLLGLRCLGRVPSLPWDLLATGCSSLRDSTGFVSREQAES